MLLEFSRYLENRWSAKVEKDGTEVRFNCPECRDTNKHFSFNIERGVSNCFRCGYKPTPLEFLVVRGGFSHDEAKMMLGHKVIASVQSQVVSSYIAFPDGYEPIAGLVGGWKELISDWLRMNRISLEDGFQMRLGVVTDKTSKYFGRVIVPVLEEGRSVYWIARVLANGCEPKYLSAPGKKSAFVWGIDSVKFQSKEVIITEGWKDAYRVNGAAIFGKFISDTQFRKIESQIKGDVGIGVMLDRDAWKEGYKLAKKFWEYSNVKKVTLYYIYKYKDPGECLDKEEAVAGSYIFDFSKIEDRIKAKLSQGKGGKFDESKNH